MLSIKTALRKDDLIRKWVQEKKLWNMCTCLFLSRKKILINAVHSTGLYRIRTWRQRFYHRNFFFIYCYTNDRLEMSPLFSIFSLFFSHLEFYKTKGKLRWIAVLANKIEHRNEIHPLRFLGLNNTIHVIFLFIWDIY